MLQCDWEISQECLLCYDQSQQRSRQLNWPQNHKLIKDLAYSSVFSRLRKHTVTMFGNDDSNSNKNVTKVIDLTSKKKQLCTCSTLYGTLFAITAKL